MSTLHTGAKRKRTNTPAMARQRAVAYRHARYAVKTKKNTTEVVEDMTNTVSTKEAVERKETPVVEETPKTTGKKAGGFFASIAAAFAGLFGAKKVVEAEQAVETKVEEETNTVSETPIETEEKVEPVEDTIQDTNTTEQEEQSETTDVESSETENEEALKESENEESSEETKEEESLEGTKEESSEETSEEESIETTKEALEEKAEEGTEEPVVEPAEEKQEEKVEEPEAPVIRKKEQKAMEKASRKEAKLAKKAAKVAAFEAEIEHYIDTPRTSVFGKLLNPFKAAETESSVIGETVTSTGYSFVMVFLKWLAIIGVILSWLRSVISEYGFGTLRFTFSESVLLAVEIAAYLLVAELVIYIVLAFFTRNSEEPVTFSKFLAISGNTAFNVIAIALVGYVVVYLKGAIGLGIGFGAMILSMIYKVGSMYGTAKIRNSKQLWFLMLVVVALGIGFVFYLSFVGSGLINTIISLLTLN